MNQILSSFITIDKMSKFLFAFLQSEWQQIYEDP